MADEAWDVVRVFDHEDHVEVCSLCEEMADGDGVEELSCSEAALVSSPRLYSSRP